VGFVANVQSLVLLILGIGAFGLTGFAAFDVVRRKAPLFPQVGRLTKPAWMGILIAAFLIALLSLTQVLTNSGNPLGFLNFIGFVAAGVYLAEVRPKLRQIDGGGRSSGPYGPY
jgi:Protein of unknown function (DUF2516)